MLRRALLGVSRRPQLNHVPLLKGAMSRFVAGEDTAAAVLATEKLVSNGLHVTLDHLGTLSSDAYLDLLKQLTTARLTTHADLSVRLSGDKLALENARTICHAARNAGTAVTLDMTGHEAVDSTLEILRELRQDFPETGVVLRANLRRTEEDCRDLASAGSRVRLCTGTTLEPESVAFQHQQAVDKSFVRSTKVLMNGAGYPMIASHDPRLLAIAASLADRASRAPDSYEFQLSYGVRPDEQIRLARLGNLVRVYVPYGEDAHAYVLRHLSERPADAQFFARSLITR